MKKISSPDEAKNKVKKTNLIIYGSIRNIEKHFAKSFSNIDKISDVFDNVLCIIFENDSSDKTRNLLKDWKKSSSKIKKHIILEDGLANTMPSRTQRLAYCRNSILKYIFENSLENTYEYALHCDLDEVFWEISIDGILTCFQYDLDEWDMMGCINEDFYYFDYWALRHKDSYFANNVFSTCYYPKQDYRQHTKTFSKIIFEASRSNDKLVPVQSCFNGMGLYRLKSMKGCSYLGLHKCGICQDSKCNVGVDARNFSEPTDDNDHINLHREMMDKNNAKLYINTDMKLKIKPGTMFYNIFGGNCDVEK
jgi:hypothetical protein